MVVDSRDSSRGSSRQPSEEKDPRNSKARRLGRALHPAEAGKLVELDTHELPSIQAFRQAKITISANGELCADIWPPLSGLQPKGAANA